MTKEIITVAVAVATIAARWFILKPSILKKNVFKGSFVSYHFYSKRNEKNLYVCGKSYFNNFVRETIEYDHLCRPTPLVFPERFKNYKVKNIACGWGHSLFCFEEGKRNFLYSFGLNGQGQLGRSEFSENILFSTMKRENIEDDDDDLNFNAMDCGREYSIVSVFHQDDPTKSTFAYIFGHEFLHQLGISHSSTYDPTWIQTYGSNNDSIASIVCGMDHAFILTCKGEVYSMGWNSDGQCGIKEAIISKPTRANLNAFIIKLSSIVDSTLALDNHGHVYAWGNSEYGQCMTGEKTDRIFFPTKVPFKKKILDIATGGAYSILLAEGGKIYTCGYGYIHGKEALDIYDGMNEIQTSLKFTSIYSGGDFVAALTDDGVLYTWGHNKLGQLGQGHYDNVNYPIKVELEDQKRIKNVYCGFNYMILETY